MAEMTTQQRLNCLLKHIDMRAERQGAVVTLTAQDITLLMAQCGFQDQNELAFYMESLNSEGLVIAECSADNTLLQAAITIPGYRHLDTLKKRGPMSVPYTVG